MSTVSKRRNRASWAVKRQKANAAFLLVKPLFALMLLKYFFIITKSTLKTVFCILLNSNSAYSTVLAMKKLFIFGAVPEFAFRTEKVSKNCFALNALIAYWLFFFTQFASYPFKFFSLHLLNLTTYIELEIIIMTESTKIF